MRLEDAIARLDAIHVQVLRSETFRGVRALPTALTGGIALIAGLVQSSCLVAADPAEFTSYWLAVAAIAATVGLLDLAVYVVRGGAIAFRRAAVVLRQVLPAFGVAAVLTVVLLADGRRRDHAAPRPLVALLRPRAGGGAALPPAGSRGGRASTSSRGSCCSSPTCASPSCSPSGWGSPSASDNC